LDPEYYQRVVELERPGQVTIVSDEPDSDYVLALQRRLSAPHRMVYVSTADTPANDFHFMRGFAAIACANSTFSWWAAYLSNAVRIYTPSCGVGHPDVKLFSAWSRATVVEAKTV
jgi:hypothetical protein